MNLLTALVLSMLLLFTTARKHYKFNKVEHISLDKLNADPEKGFQDILEERTENDKDKNEVETSIDLCVKELPGSVDRANILSLYNEIRRQAGASNMIELTYSLDLAKMASEFVDLCGNGENNPNTDHLPYDHIAFSQYINPIPEANFTAAILDWYNEKSNYDNETKTCLPDKICSYYIGTVRAKSLNVGCGFSVCPKQSEDTYGYHVCIYGSETPFTNERPYLEGPPCSQCPDIYNSCNLGLCSIYGKFDQVGIC